MAPLPEDDVPTLVGTPDDDADSDETTTALAGAPAKHLRGHIEDEPDSVTTMAPRLSPSFPGLTIPKSVAIHTVQHDDDLLDETEVRTLPGSSGIPATPSTLRGPPAPRPAAGAPPSSVPSTVPHLENDDDPVTTQAQAPRVGSAPELAASIGIPTSSSPLTEPQSPITQPNDETVVPTRPGLVDPDTVEELLSRPGVLVNGPASAQDAVTQPGVDIVDVTQRHLPRLDLGPASTDFEEDVVTTVSELAVPPKIPAPSTARSRPADELEDSNDGTTQKVNTTRTARAIEDDDDDDDGDGAPENRTAVMANAPLQRIIADLTGEPISGASQPLSPIPPIRPTSPGLAMPPGSGSGGARALAAPRLSPSSESGLRLAMPSPSSGVARAAPPLGDARPYAVTEAAFPAGPLPPQPSLHNIDLGKGPRYGLLVGIVAVISIVVPVTLFIVLRGRADEAVPAVVPTEAASELQQHDTTPRGKFDKAAVPAASASSHKGRPRR